MQQDCGEGGRWRLKLSLMGPIVGGEGAFVICESLWGSTWRRDENTTLMMMMMTTGAVVITGNFTFISSC